MLDDEGMSSRESAAFLCSHFFAATHPVLYVVRSGGDWQFLCGGDHERAEKPRVVHREHLLGRDSTLRELGELAEGRQAEREAVGRPWSRKLVSNE